MGSSDRRADLKYTDQWNEPVEHFILLAGDRKWSDHHYRSSFRLYSQKKADKIRGSINYKTNNIKKIGGKHYDEESSVNNDSSFYSSSHDGRMHIQRIIHNGSD